MNLKQKFQLLKNRICIYPGHYYSPIPSLKEAAKDRLFDVRADIVPGIDLRYEKQMELLDKCKQYYYEMPFHEMGGQERYYFMNDMYSYADGVFYYFVLRHIRPNKVIEVGSGFTSALLLDVNDIFFKGNIQCTFIEPCTKSLHSLLRESDKVNIMEKKLQDIELREFDSLKAGDILFIDSTHVVKCGSDVNYIFSEILPRISEGVYIHFHDIFFPFEYPKEWIIMGRAWNEDYMLRSFLQYNNTFEIVLWNNYLIAKNREWFEAYMPLCLKNEGGSIWLKKIRN